MEDFFYRGIWRMDWGLGNPNKTAALIATLMVASWGLAYIRRWGFWVALVLFTALGICLIHTFSRGGLIALFAGLLPVVFFTSRPWPWRRFVAVAISIWIIVGFSVYLKAHDRFGQGVATEDRSISNRLDLWRVAPQMMVDAPSGWGLGNSGIAYVQWYQPLARHEHYRTLVNSHLTWLVELGWLGRFFYVLGWLTVFLLCWPLSKIRTPWFGISFGIWLTFAVAATFSSVAESPWLWIVPGMGFFLVLGYRFSRKQWPSPKSWSFTAGMACAALVGLWSVGGSDSPLSGSEKRVVLGKGKPSVWLVWNQKIMGSNYGRSLRSQAHSNSNTSLSVGVAFSWGAVPELKNETLVGGGVLDPEDKIYLNRLITQSSNVILINPFFSPEELNLAEGQTAKIKVAQGEFSQSPAGHSWAQIASVKKIEGVGDYLPTWPTIVLSGH